MNNILNRVTNPSTSGGTSNNSGDTEACEIPGCDKQLVERIEADIVHRGQPISFDDITGLEFAKKCVIESICWYVRFVCNCYIV